MVLEARATRFGSGHALIGGLHSEGRQFGGVKARATRLAFGYGLIGGLRSEGRPVGGLHSRGRQFGGQGSRATNFESGHTFTFPPEHWRPSSMNAV